MKNLLTIIAVLILSLPSQAQDSTKPIEVRKGGLSTTFFQNNKLLNPKQLIEIMELNEPAYELMKKAKTQYDFAMGFGVTGGFLVGLPLGTAIAGGEPNWILAGIGAGLIAIAIPLTISGTKNATQSVNIYNEGLKHSSITPFELKLKINSFGLGLQYNF